MNNAVRLERNPVTGKMEPSYARGSGSLSPELSYFLLFAEGAKAWDAFSPEEQQELREYVYARWMDAKTSHQRTALAFFGNILIRMHTKASPVLGEIQ